LLSRCRRSERMKVRQIAEARRFQFGDSESPYRS
jgi:hypothetical protein